MSSAAPRALLLCAAVVSGLVTGAGAAGASRAPRWEPQRRRTLVSSTRRVEDTIVGKDVVLPCITEAPLEALKQPTKEARDQDQDQKRGQDREFRQDVTATGPPRPGSVPACKRVPRHPSRRREHRARGDTAVVRALSEPLQAATITERSYLTCLVMSMLAGLSTTLGAGVVALLPGNRVSPFWMAFILAFAGGVMLTTSALEFYLPTLLSGNTRELTRLAVCSLLGAGAFVLFSMLVPEPELVAEPLPEEEEGGKAAVREGEGQEQEGLVELSAVTARKSRGAPPAAALAKPSAEGAGPPGEQGPAGTCTGGGSLPRLSAAEVARRWRLAFVLMLSLTAHNFPEGMAVAMSALDDERLGLVVMFAIAIHNIPEGIAISVPVLTATGSRSQALWMALMSGMAEPLGAGVALMMARTAGTPSEDAMNHLLWAVGGVMSAVSLKELLPEAWRSREPVACFAGFFSGAAVMYVTTRLGA